MTQIPSAYRRLFAPSKRVLRSEFWIFTAHFSLILVATVITGALGSPTLLTVLRVFLLLWGVPTFVVLIELMVGRLRDAGYSPVYFFVAIIPVIGAVLVLIALTKNSDAVTRAAEL